MSVKPIRTIEGKFYIEGKTNFPEATSLIWYYGDGKSSTEANPTYVYKKAGRYTVRLEVQDTCGLRIYTRKVEFKNIPKPTKKPNTKPKKGNTPKKKV